MEFTKGKLIALVDSGLIGFVMVYCVWVLPLWLKYESVLYAVIMMLIICLTVSWFMSEFEE